MGILVIALYFLIPTSITYLSTKYPVINKIGIVVMCYAGGLILGNINIIPESISGIQETIMGASILLGIPLVLFSENIMKWTKMARYTFISLMLGVASVVILVIAGYFVFRSAMPEDISKISGMMIGVYTGGTANLMAIATALGVKQEFIVLTNTVEMMIGAVILLFLMTGAKPLFGLFMKPYKSSGIQNQPDLDVRGYESYDGFFKRSGIPDLLKALGISLLIAGLGFSMTFLFKGDFKDAAPILAVTTLGILASLIPAVNRINKSFQLGMYFIYIFCVIIASNADIASLFREENIMLMVNIALFITFVIVGSLIIHALLSWIFGITVDDYVITSTALADSPPFVPVVAAAMRNKEVVVPGMIIGVIGYAIGNYLGVAIAYLLK
jgi:uncharacterized membrane protein